MRGTEPAAVRGRFLVGIAVVVVALGIALLVPVVEHSRHHREAAAAASHQRRALAIAGRIVLPSTFTPTDRLGGVPCVGGPAGAGNLKCWLVPGPPEKTIQALGSALEAAGLSPSTAACHPGTLANSSPSTQGCRVTAQTQGWSIDLIAITNVVHGKLVRPKPGQRLVPPKAHVDGTEVILSAGSQ